MKNIIGYRGMAKSFININRLFYEYDIQRLSKENQKLSEENKKLENLKKWLPIVVRLEKEFKTYDHAKGINYKLYTEETFTTINRLKHTVKALETDLANMQAQAANNYILPYAALPFISQEELYLLHKSIVKEMIKRGYEIPSHQYLSNKITELKDALFQIQDIADFHDRPYKFCGEYNNCCDVIQQITNITRKTTNDKFNSKQNND